MTLQRNSESAPAFRLWVGIHALRLQNWLKNVSLFFPALLAGPINLDAFSILSVSFLAFGCTASAHYLINDFVDRNNDLANTARSGCPGSNRELSREGLAYFFVVLIGAAAACAVWLPPGFQLMLLLYLTLCFAYSLALKRLWLLDIVALVLLHDLRLVAGSYAVGVPLSPALLIAGSFFFSAMASLKRLIQLSKLPSNHQRRLAGRAYTRKDMSALLGLGSGASAAAVASTAFLLMEHTYARPVVLVVPIILAGWFWRSFNRLYRRRADEDLVVFVTSDGVGMLALGTIAVLLVAVR